MYSLLKHVICCLRYNHHNNFQQHAADCGMGNKESRHLQYSTYIHHHLETVLQCVLKDIVLPPEKASLHIFFPLFGATVHVTQLLQ